MPQPYRGPIRRFSWSPNAIDDRPELALWIPKITTNWTVVEVLQGMVLAILVKAEMQSAVAMYLALTGAASRNAVLRAAGNHTLDDDDYKTLDTLIMDSGKVQKQRNGVVHCMWAVTDEHPDALIWSPPQEQIQHIARVLSKTVSALEDSPQYFVWKESDFQSVQGKIDDVKNRWDFFVAKTMTQSFRP